MILEALRQPWPVLAVAGWAVAALLVWRCTRVWRDAREAAARTEAI